MIPLTTLYDEYIDRSKLSEHKKPSISFLPPREGSKQKYVRDLFRFGPKLSVNICFKTPPPGAYAFFYIVTCYITLHNF